MFVDRRHAQAGFTFLVPRLPESTFNSKVTVGAVGLSAALSVPCGCGFIVGNFSEDFHEGVLMVCTHVKLPMGMRTVAGMLATI